MNEANFMSDLIIWCHENDIPTGPARGSCGGSCIAYVLDIIDLNPLKWKTVFSRFANENRKEIGDIDVETYRGKDKQACRHNGTRTENHEITIFLAILSRTLQFHAIMLVKLHISKIIQSRNRKAQREDRDQPTQQIEKEKHKATFQKFLRDQELQANAA